MIQIQMNEFSKNFAHTFSHFTLRWRHNWRASVSNHQPHDCLLNRLFRRKPKKPSKLHVTGLLVRGIHRGPVNSPQKWPVTPKMSPSDHHDFTQLSYMHGNNCEFCRDEKFNASWLSGYEIMFTHYRVHHLNGIALLAYLFSEHTKS